MSCHRQLFFLDREEKDRSIVCPFPAGPGLGLTFGGDLESVEWFGLVLGWFGLVLVLFLVWCGKEVGRAVN